MKILGICGSPRKGNTEFMLRTFLDSAKQCGSETELLLLRNCNIKPCTGLERCSKTKKCFLKDDMKKIYPKIFSADVLVFCSPSYFNNVSGLMKNLMDRFNPIWEDKQLKKKKAVILSSGAITPKAAADVMKTFCRICKIKVIGTVYVTVKGNIKRDKKTITRLKALARQIQG